MLAFSRTLAGEESEHDAQGAVQRGASIVRNDIERDGGAPIRLAKQIQNAAKRQIVQIMPGVVLIGSILSVAGE